MTLGALAAPVVGQSAPSRAFSRDGLLGLNQGAEPNVDQNFVLGADRTCTRPRVRTCSSEQRERLGVALVRMAPIFLCGYPNNRGERMRKHRAVGGSEPPAQPIAAPIRIDG